MAATVTAEHKTDILIAGGGHAGLSLALALARCIGPDLGVMVVDRRALVPLPITPPRDAVSSANDAGTDPRAVAISASSRHLLDAIGVWEALAPVAAPVSRIEITDSSLTAGLRPVLLSWDNALNEPAGASTAAHIVPLPALSDALETAVRATPEIELRQATDVRTLTADAFHAHLALSSDETITARLAVAADGRHSVVREQSGIKSVGWPYGQIGIATTVAHSLDHGGIAVQHFLPAGPFAILPLIGRRCCVTWTESEPEGRRIMALGDDAFLQELDLRFGGRLGTLSLAGGRRSWPLSLHLSRAYVAPRVALIGDAAHTVHPIAGQGLNLAFRDVAALTEVIADAARTGLDFGDTGTLERYESWRRFDSLQAAAAYDAINRLFSRDGQLLRSAREFGMQVVDRLPAVKRALVGEAAGLTGSVPKLLRGELA